MPEVEWMKPVVIVVVLAVLLVAETYAPEFVGRKGRVRHGLTNLAMGLVNALVIALLLATIVVGAAGWAEREGFGLLHLVEWPAWAEWAAVLIAFDCWMYLWHRANHRLPVLWRFHSVHHSDGELDVTSALRFHVGEIVLSTLVRVVVVVLFGMSAMQLVVYEIILQPIILFHHSNVAVPGRVDRWLRYVIVTPGMHWVHHSDWQPETDSNYSSVLSVWDRLFRSFRLRDNPRTIRLGLEDYEEREWRGVWGMLKSPFVHRFERGDRAPRSEGGKKV